VLAAIAAFLVIGGGVGVIVALASSGSGPHPAAAPGTVPLTTPAGGNSTLPPDTTTTAPAGGSSDTSPSVGDWLNATGGDVDTLTSDLQSLKTDNADPANYDYTLVGDDASSIHDDLQLLRDDPQPPGAALQQQWSKVLGDLDSAAGAITGAATAQDQAAVTTGLAQMETATNELAAFNASVSGGGS
jgi:hypothetical protein